MILKRIVTIEAVCQNGIAAAEGGCVCDAGYGLTEKGCVECASGERSVAGNCCASTPHWVQLHRRWQSAPLAELPMNPDWRSPRTQDGVPVRKGEEVCPNVTMRDGVGGAGREGTPAHSATAASGRRGQNQMAFASGATRVRDRAVVLVGLIRRLVGSAMAIVHRK